MKKYILTLFAIILIIPSIALASWWNPFSWGIFHKTQTPIVTPTTNTEPAKTPEEKISDLQKQLDDLKKQQPATTTTPTVKNKKTVPVINNSAIIHTQIDATLKAKANQDALIAKKKADEQAQIDAVKAEADRQAQLKIQQANNQARDEQAQIDTQNEVQQEALQAKQAKLNAVNQQIATLNAKYASDVAKARSAVGVTLEQSDTVVRMLNSQYTIDFDTLQAQWQQIKYSN